MAAIGLPHLRLWLVTNILCYRLVFSVSVLPCTFVTLVASTLKVKYLGNEVPTYQAISIINLSCGTKLNWNSEVFFIFFQPKYHFLLCLSCHFGHFIAVKEAFLPSMIIHRNYCKRNVKTNANCRIYCMWHRGRLVPMECVRSYTQGKTSSAEYATEDMNEG